MLAQKETPNSLASIIFVALLALGLGAVIGFALSRFSPIYVVAGLLAAIVAIITIINVELGLLALVIITYTRLSDVLVHFYSAPSIAKPFISLLVVAIALQWIFYTRPPRSWGKAALLVSLYGLVIFLSLFYAADYTNAMVALDDYWKDGLIAVIVVILMRNGPSLRRVVWALVIVGLFLGSISVYQYITGTFTNPYWGFGQAGLQNISGSSSGYRIAGPIGDPNFYAQIMLVLAPIALMRFMDEKNPFLRAIALYATGVIVLTLIFTFSRGAFLSLAIMVAVLFWFYPPNPTQLMAYVLIGVVLVRFIPAEYTDRLLTLSDFFGGSTPAATTQDVSIRGRTSEMTAAWMMFADHPVFGVGVHNYPVYYQQYSRRIGLDPRTEARQAHSLYLEVAAETGLAGISVFGIIWWNVYTSLEGSRRRLKEAGEQVYANLVLSLAIGILGFLSAGFFIHAAYPRYMWLLIGLGLAIPQVVDSILTSGIREQNA